MRDLNAKDVQAHWSAPRRVTRDEQEQAGLLVRPERPANFVEPPAPIVRRGADELQVPDLPDWQRLPAAPESSVTVLKTSYTDKAKGYTLVTLPLSLAGAGLAVLIVKVGFGVPLLSLPTLLAAWIVFAGAWLLGWLAVVFVSGDGAGLFTAWRAWRLVEREQSVRLQFYREKLRRVQEEGDR